MNSCILGDQYQANLKGYNLLMMLFIPITEGYKSQTNNLGPCLPTVMAPDGCNSGLHDYRFFTGSMNFNLGYFNLVPSTMVLGQRLNFKVVERNDDFPGIAVRSGYLL